MTRRPIVDPAEIRQLNDLLAIGLERYLKQFRERKQNGHRPDSSSRPDDRRRRSGGRMGNTLTRKEFPNVPQSQS